MENIIYNENKIIPAIGFGTFQLTESNTFDLTAYALEIGYRHIDTAQIYRNEEFVGKAITQSGVAREDIFLTTKVWIDSFSQDKLIASVQQSLEKLQTSYVDLLLLHWPNPAVSLEETIPALNQAVEKGFAKSIGVSNFTISQMEQAVQLSQAPIAFNQIEYHPFLTQAKLVQCAKGLGIILQGHSSMAKGAIFQNQILKDLAEKYHKDVAQIVLRWLYQLNIVALTKSTDKARIQSNKQIFDFELSADDMLKINWLGANPLRCLDPKGLAPEWD